MKPVVLIRNEFPETFGIFPEELSGAGLDVMEVTPRAGHDLPAANEVSGIVAFGGSMRASDTDKHPWLAGEHALIGAAIEHETPVLGICLGAQILAIAAGANLHVAPSREFGYTEVTPTEEGLADELLSVYDPSARVFHWHEDTFDLPNGASLLATGEVVANQAFRLGRHAWGLQFHCEVDPPLIESWLASAGEEEVLRWGKPSDLVREEIAKFQAEEERLSRELVRRFARVVQAAAG